MYIAYMLQGGAAAEATESGQKYKNLLVTCEGGLRTITLNRPTKKNALTVEVSDCCYC